MRLSIGLTLFTIIIVSLFAFTFGVVAGSKMGNEILQKEVAFQKHRVEELSGFQTTVDVLTIDVNECRKSLDQSYQDLDQSYQDLYKCESNLVYYRKVCENKDK